MVFWWKSLFALVMKISIPSSKENSREILESMRWKDLQAVLTAGTAKTGSGRTVQCNEPENSKKIRKETNIYPTHCRWSQSMDIGLPLLYFWMLQWRWCAPLFCWFLRALLIENNIVSLWVRHKQPHEQRFLLPSGWYLPTRVRFM